MVMHIKHFRPILLILGLIILVLALAVMIRQTFSKNIPATYVPQYDRRTAVADMYSNKNTSYPIIR
jgi:hypothetical protein